MKWKWPYQIWRGRASVHDWLMMFGTDFTMFCNVQRWLLRGAGSQMHSLQNISTNTWQNHIIRRHECAQCSWEQLSVYEGGKRLRHISRRDGSLAWTVRSRARTNSKLVAQIFHENNKFWLCKTTVYLSRLRKGRARFNKKYADITFNNVWTKPPLQCWTKITGEGKPHKLSSK